MSPARARDAAAPSDSPGQILDVAERLAQTRGFNGFSYADIAAELGLTKASLHYHFPSKADLGRALIDRYTTRFAAALARIERRAVPAFHRLRRYVAIYGDVLKAGRICLCGMLAAEYTTLPGPMQDAIRAFFDVNERWLAGVLDAGRRDGSVAFEGSSADAARAITSALEGAMLLARPYGGAARFRSAAERVLREYAGGRPPTSSAAGVRRAGPQRAAGRRPRGTP
jgi:TetR/AcrR family transcriptional repressor of nem operon